MMMTLLKRRKPQPTSAIIGADGVEIVATPPERLSPAAYWFGKNKRRKAAEEARRQALPFADTKQRWSMRFVELTDMDAALDSMSNLEELRDRIRLLNDLAPMDKGVWSNQSMAGYEDEGEDDDTRQTLKHIMRQFDSAGLLDQTDVPLGMVIPAAWQKCKEAEAFWVSHPDADINLPVAYLTWYLLIRKGLRAEAAKRRADVFGMAAQVTGHGGMGNGDGL